MSKEGTMSQETAIPEILRSYGWASYASRGAYRDWRHPEQPGHTISVEHKGGDWCHQDATNRILAATIGQLRWRKTPRQRAVARWFEGKRRSELLRDYLAEVHGTPVARPA